MKTIEKVQNTGIVDFLPNIMKAGIFTDHSRTYLQSREVKTTPDGVFKTNILAKRKQASQAVQIDMAIPEGFAAWKAGSHIDLQFFIMGKLQKRSYSLVSLPEDGVLSVIVGRQQDGLISNYIHDQLKTGDQLRISIAREEFALQSLESIENLVFISLGTGITPLYAMLKEAAQKSFQGNIIFIHGAKSPESMIGYQELNSLAEQNKINLKLFFTENGNEHHSVTGRLDFNKIKHLLPAGDGQSKTAIFICGNGDFARSLQDELKLAGYSNVQSEFFTLPKRSDVGEAALISFGKSAKSVLSKANLLEAAEEAGLKPKFGCRKGICHECKTKKKSGIVSNALDNSQSGAGEEFIRICVSHPVTDVCLSEL